MLVQTEITLRWAKPTVLGQATPGGGNYIAAVEDTPDGGLVFVPNNANNDTGSALLVKTDGNGNVSWTTSHSYNGSGRARHVRPSPNGGYLVVGSCTGNGRDLFILKTDDQGNVDNCCPDPETVTATAAVPTAIPFTPSIADGPAASAAAGSEDSPGLTETNLCNGPACCITDAGTIGTQNLDVCANESATFTHNGDEVLDGNDLLQFILFSDPNDTLGSILVRANTPAFTFDPATMQPEVTYYVAAIAGNAVGGNVDLNDPCLDISNALQLIWRPLPAVTLSLVNKMDICPGACREVTATFTGSPPFTLTYTAPGLGPVTQTFPGNTGSFQVCVPANAPLGGFSVAATSLTDGYCSCQ